MKSVFVPFLCFIFFTIPSLIVSAQVVPTGAAGPYRGSSERINDLVHTKLNAKFDYSKSYLIGEVWLNLKPHFYATDSVVLDAKGMEIKNVSLFKGGKNISLKYSYDNLLIYIKLD